jgi:hypothetical protein
MGIAGQSSGAASGIPNHKQTHAQKQGKDAALLGNSRQEALHGQQQTSSRLKAELVGIHIIAAGIVNTDQRPAILVNIDQRILGLRDEVALVVAGLAFNPNGLTVHLQVPPIYSQRKSKAELNFNASRCKKCHTKQKPLHLLKAQQIHRLAWDAS